MSDPEPILDQPSRQRWLLLPAALIVQALLYIGLFLPDYRAPHIERFIYFGIALSGLWVATLYLGNLFTSARAARTYLLAGLVAGLLFRLICLYGAGMETHLSDDVYRYIFDGKLTSHGVNPFAFPPEHPLLEPYVDSTIHPNLNHPELPTIYPPFSQFFFLISYLIDSDSILGFKVVSFIFELLALAALALLLKVFNLPRRYLLIYWLAPLAILEFNLSSHQDMLYLPLLALALVTYQRKLAGWTGAILAAAVLTKFVVAIILPALFFGFTGLRRWRFCAVLLSTAALLYAPYQFFLNPPELFGSLSTYLVKWQYNGSLYTLLERSLSLITSASAYWAKMIVAPTLATATLYFSVKVKDKINAAAICLLCYVALTSTLFPWYLLVFFPFLLVRRMSAVFALVSLVWLSYWGMIGYLESGYWFDNWYLRALSYLPFYVLLVPKLRTGLLEERSPEKFAL